MSLFVVMMVFVFYGSISLYGQNLEARVAELNKLPCCDYTEVLLTLK